MLFTAPFENRVPITYLALVEVGRINPNLELRPLFRLPFLCTPAAIIRTMFCNPNVKFFFGHVRCRNVYLGFVADGLNAVAMAKVSIAGITDLLP